VRHGRCNIGDPLIESDIENAPLDGDRPEFPDVSMYKSEQQALSSISKITPLVFVAPTIIRFYILDIPIK